MNPLFKAVRSLLRFIAAGLVVVGVLLVGVEFLGHRATGSDLSVMKVAGYALLFLAGVGLFAVSSSLAAQLTDEETDAADDPDE